MFSTRKEERPREEGFWRVGSRGESISMAAEDSDPPTLVEATVDRSEALTSLAPAGPILLCDRSR